MITSVDQLLARHLRVVLFASPARTANRCRAELICIVISLLALLVCAFSARDRCWLGGRSISRVHPPSQSPSRHAQPLPLSPIPRLVGRMGALLALSRSGSGDARDLPLQYSTSLQLSPPCPVVAVGRPAAVHCPPADRWGHACAYPVRWCRPGACPPAGASRRVPSGPGSDGPGASATA